MTGGLRALTGLGYGDPDGSRPGEMNDKRRAWTPYQFFGAPSDLSGRAREFWDEVLSVDGAEPGDQVVAVPDRVAVHRSAGE